MNFNNTISENVFSPEEVEEISRTIENEISIRSNRVWGEEEESNRVRESSNSINKIHGDHGRLMVESFEFSDDIIEKAFLVASSLIDEDFEYISSSYCEYSKAYGEPRLPFHKDVSKFDDEVHLCVDYQLDSNIDWPIVIDGVKHSMNNNSAIAFLSNIQEHGRPVIQFEDGDYVKVVFIYFRVIKE